MPHQPQQFRPRARGREPSYPKSSLLPPIIDPLRQRIITAKSRGAFPAETEKQVQISASSRPTNATSQNLPNEQQPQDPIKKVHRLRNATKTELASSLQAKLDLGSGSSRFTTCMPHSSSYQGYCLPIWVFRYMAELHMGRFRGGFGLKGSGAACDVVHLPLFQFPSHVSRGISSFALQFLNLTYLLCCGFAVYHAVELGSSVTHWLTPPFCKT